MAKKANTPAEDQIFQLKITLLGSKPTIWRRVEVSSLFTLADLHTIVQESMSWDNSHLHSFNIKGRLFTSKLDFGIDWDNGDYKEAAEMTIKKAFPAEKSKIRYEYDFGDGWEHDILLEKILAPEPDTFYPRCTGGKMACPPEDCGGIWGYYNMLEIMANPKHPEYGDMMEWNDGKIDPEEFSEEEVNDTLEAIFQ